MSRSSHQHTPATTSKPSDAEAAEPALAVSATDRSSRKEREREIHRQEILEAAERAFIHKGYQHATVEEIAEAADFAVGTLYNFFKGKDDLCTQVLERIARQFMEQFEASVLGEKDAIKAIAALIALRLTHHEAHQCFFQIFLEGRHGCDARHLDPCEILPKNCRELYDHYLEEVRGIFARGVAERVFEDEDPVYLTLCLEGIVNACIAHWVRQKEIEPLAARTARVQRTFLKWIQGGRAGLSSVS
jgi:AcrR family transcriptional regulator